MKGKYMKAFKFIVLLASMAVVGTVFAATDATDATLARLAELERGMLELRIENKKLQSELGDVKTLQGDRWLTEERAAQIKSVVHDVLGDADSRASLQAAQATGGYDKGFFLASPDGNFKLKIGGQLQTRWAGSFYSTRDNNILNSNPGSGTTRGLTAPAAGSYKKSATGFEIRRMKLDFSGHVVDPSWQYRIVIAYTQNSANATTTNTNNAGLGAGGEIANLEDAYVRKDLGNGFSLQMGQFKSPFLKEEQTSSKYQLAVERSNVNQLFSAKFTQGIMGEWRGENLLFQACYNDGGNNAGAGAVSSVNNGQLASSSLNNGVGFTEWAATGRVAWLAVGNWKQFDDMTSFRGEDAGLMIGASFNWQRGGEQSSNYLLNGNIPLNGNSDGAFVSWTVDASWDLGGANIYSAFVMNTAYSIPGGGVTSGTSNINTYGLILQGGYFVTDGLEAFGRWEWMETTNEGYNNIPINSTAVGTVNVFNAGRVNIATIDANYYFNGSKNLKLTVDFGWTFSGALWFANGIYGQSIGGTDYRVEPTGGGNEVVSRIQMQLLF